MLTAKINILIPRFNPFKKSTKLAYYHKSKQLQNIFYSLFYNNKMQINMNLALKKIIEKEKLI